MKKQIKNISETYLLPYFETLLPYMEFNENFEVVYLIILTWKSPKILAVVITHIIDPILQVKIIDWELLDHVYYKLYSPKSNIKNFWVFSLQFSFWQSAF